MFFDIGAGILSSIFIGFLFKLSLTAPFLIGGIVFALLPDLDFIFNFNKIIGDINAHKHRNLVHYPLLYIPLGMVIISFFSTAWSILFGLCSLIHFIHDSIGIGWGIQWLYPFSRKHFAFLYLYRPKNKEKMPNKIIYTWKHEDIDALAEKYGDEEWFKNIYLKWHGYAIIELSIFIFALIILYLYIR